LATKITYYVRRPGIFMVFIYSGHDRGGGGNPGLVVTRLGREELTAFENGTILVELDQPLNHAEPS
jgi:hypothetical protein